MDLDIIDAVDKLNVVLANPVGFDGFLYGFSLCLSMLFQGILFVYVPVKIVEFLFQYLPKLSKFLWQRFKSRKEASK